MKHKANGNLPCHKSQWSALIDPLCDLYKSLGIFFISPVEDSKSKHC